LYRLAHEGKITYPLPSSAATLVMPAAQISPSNIQGVTPADVIGQECQPGQTPPRPGVSCQVTDNWERQKAYIVNAQKGDVILSAGCGTIGTMLRHVSPPQKFSHSGIMIQDRYAVRHSTASEQRYLDYPVGSDPLGNPAPSDGFRPDVMRYGWPGTITQQVYQAFEGEYRRDPETGKQYKLTGFSPDARHCNGDVGDIYPYVIKPRPDLEASLRPRLHAVADAALDINGHYRFYGYTKADIAEDPSFNAPPLYEGPRNPDGRWAENTLATVCSSFIWNAFRKIGIELEGTTLELEDVRVGAAERDDQTADGLYLYREDERRAAADYLLASTHDKVMEKAKAEGLPGIIWEFFAGAADNVANQTVNCFGSDGCDTEDKDSDRWKHPGVGRAVSPDNILMWDVWGGYNEHLVYQPSRFGRIYTWQPSEGTGMVMGRVFYEGAPAADAVVTLAGITVPTNADGEYTFRGIPAGTYEITASKQVSPDRFATDQKDVTVASGAISTVDLYLGFAPPPQPQVNVHVVVDRIHAYGCWGTWIDPWIGPSFCAAPEDPDFYAIVTIDDREFNNYDQRIEDNGDISPSWDFSTEVDPSKSVIPLSIDIKDDDGFFRFGADTADINLASGRTLNMLIDMKTCTVSGDASGSCEGTIYSEGGKDGHEDLAQIWFRVFVEVTPP
jgi:hypothetical protein